MSLTDHRWRRAAKSGATYLLAGLTNTAFSYGLYLLLAQYLDYRLSYSVAYAIGIGTSYLLNAGIVFKTPMGIRSFLLYPLVYGVQYLVSISLLAVLVDYFGMVYWLAPFVIIGLTVPLSYAMTRWILHRFAPPSPPISPATPGDSDEQTTYRNR